MKINLFRYPVKRRHQSIKQGIARLLVALLGIMIVSTCLAKQSDNAKDDALLVFLKANLHIKGSSSVTKLFNSTTRYSYATADLNGNGKLEIIVYVTGRAWCGSGGCTALILKRNKSCYKVIQKLTLARLPILILPTKTNGWHDIAMPVAGGGVVSGYFGTLRFDGKKYRPVASMPKSEMPPKGAVPLSLKRVGSLLYPKAGRKLPHLENNS